MTRRLILVTNDDGILAPGIEVLASAVAGLGEVIVCAPETERSGSSHAITLHSHLRARAIRPGWWSISGTPVDCVYMAILHLCARKPDLVVSGINPGLNLGSDVFYSGTVGGAAEGFMRGISAIAVSAERGVDPRWAVPVTRRLARALFGEERPRFLNVNVPAPEGHEALTGDAIEANATALPVEITTLGHRVYMDSVVSRTDLMGNQYYWIGGPPTRGERRHGEDTDAILRGTISVTPLEMDITARDLDPARRLLERSELEANEDVDR